MIISSWEGYSAGSKPTGKVHPGALEILALNGVKTEGYKSMILALNGVKTEGYRSKK